MKKEHYTHVSVRFTLEQYSTDNHEKVWEYRREGKTEVSKIMVVKQWMEGYSIGTAGLLLFINIPTRELAEEIVQYIKDTEVLFI